MTNNDDRKLKDLAQRLTAMSPEAPPFPEETTMSQPSARRFSPTLAFAGAAIAVLLAIGIPLVLLNSGDAPPVGAETSTTTVPDNSTTVNPSETTTTPPDEQSTTTVTSVVDNIEYVRPVFLATDSENSFLGNPALVPFESMIFGSEDVNDLLLAVHLLGVIELPDARLPDGYFNAIPRGVDVNSIEYGPDFVATIDMNEAFLDGSNTGLLGDYTMLNQLIYTLTADPDVASVLFTVNGSPVEAFGSEGLDLSGPVDRETFQEHLALIYLTSPVLRNQEGNVVVEGISNTFEASIALRVLDGAGEVVHEEFGTATCGSGCWGDYRFVLNPDLFDEDSSVQVFEYSAEDGDPQNIVTVPYNGGAPWDFLP